MKHHVFAGALALALGTASSSAVLAQDVWTMGSAKQQPDVAANFDKEFADAVADAADEISGFDIQFVGNEQEMVQQVVRGRLDAGATSSLALSALMPDLAVLNVPYLWLSEGERDYVYENFLKAPLREMYAEKGLILLSVQEAGYNGVFCKFDCSDPESLVGKKARVSPSASSRLFWESLQAIPVQLPLSDAWPALEQNLVVAGELPIGYFSTTPGAAVAQDFVYTYHTHTPWTYFINARKWNSLNEESKQAVLDAMPEEFSTSARFTAFQDTRADVYKEMGGTLHTLTDEERMKWADKVTPNIPDYIAGMGKSAQALYKVIEAGKAEYAAKSK